MSAGRIVGPLAILLGLAGCAGTGGPPVAEPVAGPVSVRILALNDFHGYLEAPERAARFYDGGEEVEAQLGGVAQMGGLLESLRAENANNITVAAGDLIGGSPLLSSYFLDEPAIASLSQIGLDLASVGNHEFDRGTDELRRMQDGGCEQYSVRTPCAIEPFAGADFQYLAANVVDDDGATLFPGTALRDFGAAKVGFIGMTLEDTPNLVANSATEGYRFLDEAQTANRLAGTLVAAGADTVVLLIHQGGYVQGMNALADCPGFTGAIIEIEEALDPAISVIVSGHTHNAYVCELDRGGASPRLLTSAGRYGGFLSVIDLTIDPASNQVTAAAARNLPVKAEGPGHPGAAAITQRYAAASAAVSERPVAAITGYDPDAPNCLDNTAQDFVADAQLYAARRATGGEVDFAFVNNGGVRADMSVAADGVLTYGEIFAMQPFANYIEILEMSGAQVKQVLEQQYCAEDSGRNCYARLVPSANVAIRVDSSRPFFNRIVAVDLDGEPLQADRLYRVAVNNFLAGGGDGFSVFVDVPRLGSAGVDTDAVEAYVANNAVSVPRCGRVLDIAS